MSRYVDDRGKILPRSFFEPPLDLPEGACPHCGGGGQLAEQIDEERYDVLVPCFHCRKYCVACRAWVKIADHRCAEAKL